MHVGMRTIFLSCIIPGLCAFAMVLLVKEQPATTAAKAKIDINLRQFPKGYWKYLAVTALFGLGNSSNAFLILRRQDIGASLDAATIEQHTHHAAGSQGSECIACHMPKIAETIGDVKVRSHTFRFAWPAQTEELKIPNACNLCHTDKTTEWATAALRSWSDRSPWRSQ